jgi:two-component system sensor histidine kinase YesM
LVEDSGDDVAGADIEALNALRDRKQGNVERTALPNIHQRLRLRHGEASGLAFSRSELGGLRVEMTIVFKELKDDTPSDR